MFDLNQLTSREEKVPHPNASSSVLSSDDENEEIRQALENIKNEFDRIGASLPNEVSDGRYSDAVGGRSRTEEQDRMETPRKTIKATDKAVKSVPGSQGNTLAPYLQGKTQMAPAPSESLSYLPSRPFQAGLGTLSILPPEIRLQIWEMIIPTRNFCIKPKPKQERSRDFLIEPKHKQERSRDPSEVQCINTLGLLRTSKQIHDEVETQFFRGRNLVIIFTTARDPSERRASLQKARSTNPGLILDGIYLVGPEQPRVTCNYGNFASIKLHIELPRGLANEDEFMSLLRSVGDFSHVFSIWQMQAIPRCNIPFPWSRPKIEVVGYTRMYCDDVEDLGFELSLQTLALLLDPLRNITFARGGTVEVNHHFRYGMEWLPELLRQVADDMQNDRISMCGQWRQKYMQCALFQSALFTGATLGHDSGGPLPIGMPEELTDDGVEYLTDITDIIYDLPDYQMFLDTGELPYRPPGRPIKVGPDYADFLGSKNRLESSPKTFNDWDSDSSDITTSASNKKRLDRQRSRDVLPNQSAPFPFNASESQAEQHSPTEAPAVTHYSPLVGSETISSTSVIALEDKRDQPTTRTENASPSSSWNICIGSSQAKTKEASHIYPWAMYNTFPNPEAEEAPTVYPWNKYRTSPIPKAKKSSPTQEVEVASPTQSNEATKGNIPDAATFTDLEIALMGLLFAIVMFWLHRVI
ncbi:MAG: hypothetical protein Q9204_004175 [Flavoplaca sp. TL-2023a]